MAENEMGTDTRIARLMLERERLRQQKKELCTSVNKLTDKIAALDMRMLEEARRVGQKELPLEV